MPRRRASVALTQLISCTKAPGGPHHLGVRSTCYSFTNPHHSLSLLFPVISVAPIALIRKTWEKEHEPMVANFLRQNLRVAVEDYEAGYARTSHEHQHRLEAVSSHRLAS